METKTAWPVPNYVCTPGVTMGNTTALPVIPLDPGAIVKFEDVLHHEDRLLSFYLFNGAHEGRCNYFSVASGGDSSADAPRAHVRLPMAMEFATKNQGLVVDRLDRVPGLLLVSMAWSGIRCRENTPEDQCLFNEIMKTLCDAIGDVFPEEGFAELVMSFVPPLEAESLR